MLLLFCYNVTIDGLHMYSRFNGVGLGVHGQDAADGLVTLALCLCDAENKANWIIFINAILAVLGDVKLIISDKEKGLEALRELTNAEAAVSNRDPVCYML